MEYYSVMTERTANTFNNVDIIPKHFVKKTMYVSYILHDLIFIYAFWKRQKCKRQKSDWWLPMEGGY